VKAVNHHPKVGPVSSPPLGKSQALRGSLKEQLAYIIPNDVLLQPEARWHVVKQLNMQWGWHIIVNPNSKGTEVILWLDRAGEGTDEGPSAPLANLIAPAAISVTTSVHAVE
jgi:hypothetical protein